MACLFLTRYILEKFKRQHNNSRNKTTSNNSGILNYSKRTSLYLDDIAGTRVPYDDLWYSAVRCKLVHLKNRDVHTIWDAANSNNPIEEILPSMDDAYIQELKGKSIPVCFETRCKSISSIGISIYAWHNKDNVYLTVHMDINSEIELMKHKVRFYNIFDNVAVNRFFYIRLLSVITDIIAYLKGGIDPRRALIVSGYSFGGIMAQIMSAIIGNIFPNLYIKCHTFGSPKPGNDAFAKWFSGCVRENYRVINSTDPIVMFPISYKWCHTEKVTISLYDNLGVHITYYGYPWYKRIFFTSRIIKSLKNKYKKYHHNFDLYISRLWKYVRIASYLYSASGQNVL